MAEVDRESHLQVMTFNVRGSYHRDGRNAWRHRADLNVRVIRRYAPDLIGFQEFQGGNRRFYEANLSNYERLPGPEYENHPPRSRNEIYWNPGRLALVDNGGFWLSETPEKFSRSWNTHQVRCANWARFRLARDGTEFVHLNAHLDHKSVEARRQAASLIVRRLEGLDGRLPVLITGDFNAEPAFAVHRIFSDAGFSDTHLVAGEPPTRTFHKFQGDDFVPRRPDREGRIDWILSRDGTPEIRWACASYRVVRDAEPPIYPSDHYPVLADVKLETTAPQGHLT